MYQKVECVMIKCDNCKRQLDSNYSGYSIFGDELHADENAEEDEWYVNNGIHYCPKCWDFDKNDNLIIKAL